MSDKKEKNRLYRTKKINNQILDLLTYCRMLAGNFRYIIFLRPSHKRSKKTLESYFLDRLYRPCDDIYELIYDSSEHPCQKKHDDSLKYYLEQHIIFKELESCGFTFKWKNRQKQYTVDGVTFVRRVPWYWTFGGVDLDIEILRSGLGLLTHQIFFKSESRVSFCLIHEEDYRKLLALKSPLIQDFVSFSVVQEEDLSFYAIGNI